MRQPNSISNRLKAPALVAKINIFKTFHVKAGVSSLFLAQEIHNNLSTYCNSNMRARKLDCCTFASVSFRAFRKSLANHSSFQRVSAPISCTNAGAHPGALKAHVCHKNRKLIFTESQLYHSIGITITIGIIEINDYC